jgi:hypothetical protein
MEHLKLKYPKVDGAQRKELKAAMAQLRSERH